MTGRSGDAAAWTTDFNSVASRETAVASAASAEQRATAKSVLSTAGWEHGNLRRTSLSIRQLLTVHRIRVG